MEHVFEPYRLSPRAANSYRGHGATHGSGACRVGQLDGQTTGPNWANSRRSAAGVMNMKTAVRRLLAVN